MSEINEVAKLSARLDDLYGLIIKLRNRVAELEEENSELRSRSLELVADNEALLAGNKCIQGLEQEFV